jgi:hypothetical protein
MSGLTRPVIFSPSVVGRFYERSLTLRAGLANRVAIFGRRFSIVEVAVKAPIHISTLDFRQGLYRVEGLPASTVL